MIESHGQPQEGKATREQKGAELGVARAAQGGGRRRRRSGGETAAMAKMECQGVSEAIGGGVVICAALWWRGNRTRRPTMDGKRGDGVGWSREKTRGSMGTHGVPGACRCVRREPRWSEAAWRRGPATARTLQWWRRPGKGEGTSE